MASITQKNTLQRYALLSVSDKTGLLEFARSLAELGYQLLSTGGTYQFLKDSNVSVISIAEYTDSPEILDGRVKTLHPKVHAGILARRDLPKDIDELSLVEAGLIEIVAVNLYPFMQKVAEVEAAKRTDHGSLIEYIDIGGPTMLRAAAKNCAHVLAVSDPSDYQPVIAALKSGEISRELRLNLAGKVFTTMAAYDGAVARYFSLNEELLENDGTPKSCAPIESITLKRVQELRYGENPHQHAGLYRRAQVNALTPAWKQLQGKEISYNNLLDLHAALDLFVDLTGAFSDEPVAVIIKHLNPCGVALGTDGFDAFTRARACDPVSAFGGIVAVSGTVDARLAELILEGFVEIVVAQSFDAGAMERFQKKKNVRVIECDTARLAQQRDSFMVKNSFGDFFLQSPDAGFVPIKDAQVVSRLKPSKEQLRDLEFAWIICKHVKSNAIVVTREGQAIGIGAGQMSRVDSAKLALMRAAAHGFSTQDAVAASDAFLPFPDTLEILNDGGIQALVQPGGSIKDEEVIAVADQRKVAMLVTGERHFRH